MNELASKISASELEVLQVLWRSDAPMPIAAVRSALERSRSWDASTVKTLLRRLCEKQAVAAEKREVYYYRPILTQREYQAWSTRSFIDKVYWGSAKALVASLVEGEELSPADLEDLRSVLYPGGEEEHG